ncbi:SGNH/GDSL hydrolase family protein [Termitidicoccus mucosus]|uniref:SGNH hydrolase-type esterase domain-containing protein n=1 Tax=Termitidicoccus mucosus TaxID=1184151 RepID=A0A178IA58_9BACT|nr:hypothetical protein AW736_25870 [Opitutaceae bacterium TSB47]
MTERAQSIVMKTLLVLLSCLLAVGPAVAAVPELAPFHARGGLPNFRAKAERGGEVRVAYLGGSITAEEGWRTLSLEFLRERFPRAKVAEIFAAAPGTGSDLGVCRLQADALRHAPDLLFVEFAVNDETARDERVLATMEGIVRQARRMRPELDICFVYTLSFRGLPDLRKGGGTRTVRVMERVAEFYGVPSVHMAATVARRLDEGSLVFGKKDGDRCGPGQVLFTRDGVHPTAEGHRVCMETLAAALPVLLGTGAPAAHGLGEPLAADNWERATIMPVAALGRRDGWTRLPADGRHLAHQPGLIAPETWAAPEAGAALEFTTRGPVLGLAGMSTPDSGQFSVTVDGGAPVTASFFDRFTRADFMRMTAWFYPLPLDDGAHRVRVELTGARLDKAKIKDGPLEDAALYEGHGMFVGGALVAPPDGARRESRQPR